MVFRADKEWSLSAEPVVSSEHNRCSPNLKKKKSTYKKKIKLTDDSEGFWMG